jgi:hypothetical protein
MQIRQDLMMKFRASINIGILVVALHGLLLLCLVQRLHQTKFVQFKPNTNAIPIAIYQRATPEITTLGPVRMPTAIGYVRPNRELLQVRPRLNLDKQNFEPLAKIPQKAEINVRTSAEVDERTRGVEPSLKDTKPDSGEAIQVSKDAISGASRRQEKLDRERKILGLTKESDETVLAVQIRKSVKPDCLKAPNSDSTNNVSNLALAIGNIIQDKCNLR